jgi:hypothetical protein
MLSFVASVTILTSRLARRPKKPVRRGVSNTSAEHFENMLGCAQGIDKAGEVGAMWGG